MRKVLESEVVSLNTDWPGRPGAPWGMNQLEVKRTSHEPAQLNERLWQAWLIKNREMDRAGAVRRWKILKIVAVVGVVGAIVQTLIGNRT